MDKKCEKCYFFTYNCGGSSKGKCNFNPEKVDKMTYDFCGQFEPKVNDDPLKAKFDCIHAHDYSAIERNGETYIEITNDDDMEDTDAEGTVLKIEYITELLNKAENQK